MRAAPGPRWAVIVLGLLGMVAVLAPVLAPHPPTAIDLNAAFRGVSWSNPLGTDNLGRDVLSRLCYAARTDLFVAAVVTALPLVFGSLVGTACGWYRGWLPAVVMRVVDVVSAFPFVVLVLVVLAVVGPGVTGVLIAVPGAAWVVYARLARAEVLVVERSGVVESQRVLGMPASRILLRHVLPLATRPCVAYCTTDFASNLVLVASLSYLGVGVQPPTPEWGAMIAEAQPYLGRGWLPAVSAAAAVVLTGICASALGDGLAQRLGWSAVSERLR